MSKRAILAAAALTTAAALLVIATVRSGSFRRAAGGAPGAQAQRTRALDAAALQRLHAIPFYQALTEAAGLRSCTLDEHGTVHVELDVRAIVGPRLASFGLGGAMDLLPATAFGTIVIADGTQGEGTAGVTENWLIPGPVPALDILDRAPAIRVATTAGDALPENPAAIVRMRLLPSRLADPSFGGAALASWRDRAEFAESLFGRPWRAQVAEDLAGPAVFALYESADGGEADGVLAVELRRSDRIGGLLDMLFGLGALTERGTVNRYRGVATGSFTFGSDGPGLALAVDGPILLVATSRARLESAIDARRSDQGKGRFPVPAADVSTSWSAESGSIFAARGWCRLAHCAGPAAPPQGAITAALTPEGRLDWRLEGRGPAPAITADPLVPFLKWVLAKR